MAKSSLEVSDRKKLEKLETRFGVEFLEFIKDNDGIRPTLINGQPVERLDWPEVVRIRVDNGGCTATLVGPNCAITAAHCGRNGANGDLELHDGTQVPFTVIQMPQYQNGATNDLSLLKLGRNVSTPFARIGLDHTFSRGQRVLLAGYGCTRPNGTGGNDGILRIGPSKIVGESGTDIVSEWREQNGAALCFGDSGGPMFADEATAGNRLLVAVNSKGNIRDTNYNMRLNLESVRTFLTRSSTQHGLQIKGLNLDDEDGDSDARQVLEELANGLTNVNAKLEQLRQVMR
jgi:hypothetical protein